MSGLESIPAYLSRLLTLEALAFAIFLMLIATLVRAHFSQALKISNRRFLLIALSFAGILSLSLRFWEQYGFNDSFWLFDSALWSADFKPNANLLLNVLLYVPAAALLVLAGRRWFSVLFTLVLLSFLIETIQQYARIGSADPIDLVANTAGASLGVVLGLVLRILKPSWAAKS